MSHPRLSLAVSGGGITPPQGLIGVFAPTDQDLGDLPKAHVRIMTASKPVTDRYTAMGFDCATDVTDRFVLSVVFVPRAKALARGLIAQAGQATDGPVLVDGPKTNGIDSLLKEARRVTEVSAPISKAHGKLFWLTGGSDLTEWEAPAFTDIEQGFVTAPGVFSADGIDPASQLLIDQLPAKLGGHLADLGAGWGFLARHILTRDDVKALHLVEADKIALRCAERNVTDARAQFEWADGTKWKAPRRLDGVIMNPPFHTGRAAEPGLGQAFIATAARNLAPHGQLWMVANRHLPYETALAQFFMDVKELAGDNRFKVLFAARPSRNAR